MMGKLFIFNKSIAIITTIKHVNIKLLILGSPLDSKWTVRVNNSTI